MDCPNQNLISHGPCLDLGELNIALNLIEAVRGVVNQFRAVMGEPDVPALDLSVELGTEPVCMGKEICGKIGTYVDGLFDTGYVYRKTYKTALSTDEWPWPGDAENIARLKECDAFWGSMDEIYGCMRELGEGGASFDSAKYRAVFGSPQVDGACIDETCWKQFCSALACADGNSSPCFPDCTCPVCVFGSCEACNVDMCVWFAYTDPSGTEWVTEFKTSLSGSGDCVASYLWDDGGFFFDPGDNKYELTRVQIDVVKGHAFIWMDVTADGAATGFLVPEVVDSPSDTPGDLCMEWEPLYVLLAGGELQLYHGATGVSWGKIRIRWIGFGDCPEMGGD